MLKDNIIVDVDGTIADIGHRLHYIEGLKKKDWDSFLSNCPDDKPKLDVIEVVNRIAGLPSADSRLKINVFTGRSESVREQTRTWLEKYFGEFDSLYMRANGDYRPDHIVKREMLIDAKLNIDNVLVIVDDRKSVVEMWRSLGFLCFQVAKGDF